MGRNIGTLGQQRPELDLEFTYFDATIRVHPHATDAVEIEFLEAGKDIDLSELENLDMAKIEAMSVEDQGKLLATFSKAQVAGHKALMTALRRLIHPEDFPTYWQLASDHGQRIRDLMADIQALTQAVVESATDFPTPRRFASPPGPATTRAVSEVSLPSADVPALPPQLDPPPASPVREGTDLERALALERGRPDIQEFYIMLAEERQNAVREQQEREARDRAKLAAAGLRIG